VIEQRDDDHEGQHLHPLRREDRRPALVAELGTEQQLRDQRDREQGHQHRRHALSEPVAKSVVRTDDQAFGTEAFFHRPGL
jgi:hypothetical protein